eukprot:symbB.v1.2.009337.t1/scaffold561.1/size520142/5
MMTGITPFWGPRSKGGVKPKCLHFFAAGRRALGTTGCVSAAVAVVLCRGRETSKTPREFLLLERSEDQSRLELPRMTLGFPLVRLEVGEAIQVAAARALEEECALTASFLRWHPVPITSSLSAWSTTDSCFLVAHCFAWYSPPKEQHFPNPYEESFRWLGRQELRDVARRKHLGLNFAREVLTPLEVAETLIDRQVLREPES